MDSSHTSQLETPNRPDAPLEAAGEVAVSPETAPDYSVPPTRWEQLKSSKWRPIAAFAGAILVSGVLVPLIAQPTTPAVNTVAISSWELALPQSSTMMTELSTAPGAPIRGQVSPVADITGKAPVGGAVARWVVEPGTSVQAGQAVVQISSGSASAPALPGESHQIEAEKQQTQAADDQLALSQRLSSTQQKLAAAQERVERAQLKVSDARQVIAGLRSGGARPDVPPPAPRRKAATAPSDSKIAATRAATREAQSAFDLTGTQLKAARADLSATQRALAPLQAKVEDTQANVKVIEGKFDGSLASASDVQAARSARDNAKSTLESAGNRLESAQKQIPILEKQLATRERALEEARRAERAAAQAAPANTETETEAAPAPRANSSSAVSVEDAATMVKEALAESRAATREADRLRALIDGYQAQAQKSNRRIESATQNLERAQERAQSQMVQSVPRVRFTAARAPADGVVVWVARLAREVGAGQSVFGMSSGKTYQARFEDRTGNWRNARVGQVVSALLAPPAPTVDPVAATLAPVAPTSDGGSPPMPMRVGPASGAATPTPELDADSAIEQGATPVKVRLTRIAPPESAGDPAILEGELLSPSGAAGPDYRLLASLPSVGAPDILTVPNSALVQRDGAWMVAVIEPDSASEAQPEVTPVAPEALATEDEKTRIAGTLAWRKVAVGQSDGIARRVSSGLKAGERIVTDPIPLIAQAPPESATMPRVKLSAT